MSAQKFVEDYSLDTLRVLNDKLNEKVLEQMVNTQELVLLNNFAHESNEYLLKKSLEQRISDISSWHWVLVDLTKRLEESIEALKHEHKALQVVTKRIADELSVCSQQGMPPTLGTLTDSVEDAIIQEQHFLRNEKKRFEKMIPELEKQINSVDKTKKRIEKDILKKQQTLAIEDACVSAETNPVNAKQNKKRRRYSLLSRWENKCESLKKTGLKALRNAVVTRQQVRGARVQISIAAQGYAAKVDSTLRRRLHANQLKLQDFCWQKDEAIKDYNSLEEELTTTEQNLLENLDQEKIIESRIADRSKRPPGELTKDDVDRKLRDELARIRSFNNELRKNRDRITSLQNNLTNCISRIDCCSEDLIQVINLDEERIRCRNGEVDNQASEGQTSPTETAAEPLIRPHDTLAAIIEEDEDDYPLDY